MQTSNSLSAPSSEMPHTFSLSPEELRSATSRFPTPFYLYDEATLTDSAQTALAMPAPFGLTVRFAMKALPTKRVLELFNALGLHIDASSEYEAERAIAAGVPPQHILLTAQEPPRNLRALVSQGVLFNATSLWQLESYGELFPNTKVSIRVNPGLGSGHNNRTNVGGPSSSFGIWKGDIPAIHDILKKYALTVERVHSHVGSGSDPATWERCGAMTLELVRHFPDATTVSFGGGFKVARVPGEISADLQKTGALISELLQKFAAETGRSLALEIEPGTFLAARGGAIVSTVVDIVSTTAVSKTAGSDQTLEQGQNGYTFLKLDAGMTELLRPALYGAQHPITLYRNSDLRAEGRDNASGITAASENTPTQEYLIVGHCCESGDIFTPEPGNPEGLKTRTLPVASRGDIVVIGFTGAYASGFSVKNYNSFPEAAEILRKKDGTLELIKRRQSLAQILENEV